MLVVASGDPDPEGDDEARCVRPFEGRNYCHTRCVEAQTQFFGTMSQVGITAFALMFAALQIRWNQVSRSRLGKLSTVCSLLELLAAAIISLAVITGYPLVWQITGLACLVAGYWATLLHRSEYRRSTVGEKSLPSNRAKAMFGIIPFLSYGTIGACSALAFLGVIPVENALGTFSIVTIWFVISGSFESFLTLSPHWLSAEEP